MEKVDKKENMDQIKIENLKVFAYHGVFPEENEKGQFFYVDAVLYLHTRKAGKTDELSLSVNYGEVCHLIYNYMTKHTFCLLETIAEGLAENILLNFTLVEFVDLKIKKPEAPIGLPFENVSIAISRGWHKTYIALGSNMGDKEKYIYSAIQEIRENKLCKNVRVSQLITTEPYGVTNQDEFLNGVLEMKTLLNPDELLEFLHVLENKAQRVRKTRWGPRTLDLDILLYDQLIYDSKDLTIPHPDMQNREFVLVPLAELASREIHPLYQKTVKEMIEELLN